MKKLIFSLSLFLSLSSLVHAQWTTSGTITSTTNSVGIGTNANLLGLLNIVKSSAYNTENTAGIVIHTGTNAQPELLFGTDNTNIVSYIQSLSRLTNYGNVPLSLQPNGGKVGIGTLTPVSALDVNGNLTVSATAGIFFNSYWSGDWKYRANGYGNSMYQTSTGDFAFATMGNNTSGAGSVAVPDTKMTILNNGNVGIGTTTPKGLLHIKSLSETDNVQITKSRSSPNLDIYSVYNGSDDIQTGSFGYGVRPSAAAWQIWEKHTGANWLNLFTVIPTGNVGIGITNPQNKLDVNGTIHSKAVNIDLNGWGDYVFKKDYQLRSLSEVKAYIDQNQHLPEIPSEQEMIKKGLDVSEMNKLLMKKVEELTLYLIQKEEQLKKQQVQIEQQQQVQKKQDERLQKLEQMIARDK